MLTTAVPRTLGASVAFLAIVALPGCGREDLVSAVGPNDEISVFTNTPPGGPVAREIARIYGYEVEVVGREPSFYPELVPYVRFDGHKHVKNQIFAVDLSGDDRLARDMPGIVKRVDAGKLRTREPFRLMVRDLWAFGQTTLIAAAWSGEDLLRLLAESDSASLRFQFETAVAENLPRTMFAMGEDRSLPARLAREFGWTMRLLPGFLATSDRDKNVVKLNAPDPVRLVFVHWVDGAVPLEESSWSGTLERLLDVYNDGDYVLADRTDARSTHFQGEPAVRWEGVWQNDKYVMGGPFRAYAFQRGGRSFLLVGLVFAPGHEKVPILRQLEGLFRTFRPVT